MNPSVKLQSNEKETANGLPTILAVDNFPDWHCITRAALRGLSLNFVFAGSVKEASFLLEGRQFDLVISGVRMPDGTGYDIFLVAKSLGIPFVLCTHFPPEMIWLEVGYKKFAYLEKSQIKNLPAVVSGLLEQSK